MEPRAPLPSADSAAAPEPPDLESGATEAGPPDLAALPIAGITRRRLAFLLAAICSVWIVIVFGRQVGEASAAAARLEALRNQNVALQVELAALEDEYRLIQQETWIVQQGRAHRLGSAGEIAVTRPRPPQLAPDAPGSAAVRLGATTVRQSPLDSWLELLFGPTR